MSAVEQASTWSSTVLNHVLTINCTETSSAVGWRACSALTPCPSTSTPLVCGPACSMAEPPTLAGWPPKMWCSVPNASAAQPWSWAPDAAAAPAAAPCQRREGTSGRPACKLLPSTSPPLKPETTSAKCQSWRKPQARVLKAGQAGPRGSSVDGIPTRILAAVLCLITSTNALATSAAAVYRTPRSCLLVPAPAGQEYVVSIKTADEPGAGTDAEVLFQLKASAGLGRCLAACGGAPSMRTRQLQAVTCCYMQIRHH